MWLDVGVVCGKALDAIGVHRLLTNPHRQLALFKFRLQAMAVIAGRQTKMLRTVAAEV